MTGTAGRALEALPAPRSDSKLDEQRACADQVGETLSLLGIEQRVDAAEGLGHGVAQALGRRDAQSASLLGTRLVERVLAERVRERRHRSPPVDLALGALDLELVEDAGKLGDLTLVELQLVGQEPQRTPDSERTAS